jgi:acylphosphatase
MPARGFLVRGRVQGVGYRYFVLRAAESLSLAGWARNLPDGSVEVVAEGGEAALEDLEGRLRAGPGLARVSGVERVPAAPVGGRRFTIR